MVPLKFPLFLPPSSFLLPPPSCRRLIPFHSLTAWNTDFETASDGTGRGESRLSLGPDNEDWVLQEELDTALPEGEPHSALLSSGCKAPAPHFLTHRSPFSRCQASWSPRPFVVMTTSSSSPLLTMPTRPDPRPRTPTLRRGTTWPWSLRWSPSSTFPRPSTAPKRGRSTSLLHLAPRL